MSDVCWYVLRTKYRQELMIRDSLRRAGFHCYVPMFYRLETVNDRKVRRLIPAISNLVFVHATQEAITDYKLHSKNTFYWLTKPQGRQSEKIIVSDKAMDCFIRVTMQNELSVTYFRPEEIKLNKGDRIKIHGGIFDGVEGILLKIKGKREKQLVVSIPGISAAAVSVRPDILEVVSRKVASSRNLQSDIRELIRLNTRMLTSPPDSIIQSTEYEMLRHEILRLYESLKYLKGYVPSVEGELSLSLLMAEYALGEYDSETEQRYLHALSLQKQQTILQVRMLFIGGTLLHRHDLLTQAQKAIAMWKNSGPSARQTDIISESIVFSQIDATVLSEQ